MSSYRETNVLNCTSHNLPSFVQIDEQVPNRIWRQLGRLMESNCSISKKWNCSLRHPRRKLYPNQVSRKFSFGKEQSVNSSGKRDSFCGVHFKGSQMEESERKRTACLGWLAKGFDFDALSKQTEPVWLELFKLIKSRREIWELTGPPISLLYVNRRKPKNTVSSTTVLWCRDESVSAKEPVVLHSKIVPQKQANVWWKQDKKWKKNMQKPSQLHDRIARVHDPWVD